MENSFRHEFWQIMCGFRRTIFYIFVLNILFIVLLGFSLLFLDPASDGFVVLKFNSVIFGTGLLVSGLILVKCNQIEK